MECTNCGLINPETAERCDCGYDFAAQVVKVSYVPAQQVSFWNRWVFLLIPPAIFTAIGPLVGFFSSFFLPVIVRNGISEVTARDLGFSVGLVPMSYVLGGIPALCTGILYAVIAVGLPHKILRNFLCRVLLGGAIGTFSTDVYYQFGGLDTDLALEAGLPAGAICSLLLKNWPPNRPLRPTAEKVGG